MNGTSAERVRIEAAPHSTGDLPGCSVSIRQEGDTVEVNMPASDGCRADMDLRVEVPRRFGATILAPEAGEVVVRDLEGRVAGEASPELECQFQGFRSSMSCAGGQFDVTFSAGEFAMRARNRE